MNYPPTRASIRLSTTGDSVFHLWYQLTQISDNMKHQLPSGQLNAHIATANVYGNTIRDSGVCAGGLTPASDRSQQTLGLGS